LLNSGLIKSVENFASVMLPLTEKDLEHPYAWKGYEEGLRFTFFMTILELRQLAVTLSAQCKPLTQVQQILGQYHCQYMDLQSAVFGLSAKDAETSPAENEWPVKDAYAHILGAEFGFRAIIRYALEGHRAGTWTSDPPAESEYPRLYGISENEYGALMKGPFEEMLAFHRELHPSILDEFSFITDAELDQPSAFWEETRFPIRYRLHRFEAHILQHTIQIDKTLVAIGAPPSESKRLIRYVFAALAEVNAILIGAESVDTSSIETVATGISERAIEIEKSLKQRDS
jgi:hypothetical protein